MKKLLWIFAILSVFYYQSVKCQIVTKFSFKQFQILSGNTANPKTGEWITKVFWEGGKVDGNYTQELSGKIVSGKFMGNGRLQCKDSTEYPVLFLTGSFFVQSFILSDISNDSILKFKNRDTIFRPSYVVKETITDSISKKKIEKVEGNGILVLRKNAYDDSVINESDVIGVLPKRKK